MKLNETRVLVAAISSLPIHGLRARARDYARARILAGVISNGSSQMTTPPKLAGPITTSPRSVTWSVVVSEDLGGWTSPLSFHERRLVMSGLPVVAVRTLAWSPNPVLLETPRGISTTRLICQSPRAPSSGVDS